MQQNALATTEPTAGEIVEEHRQGTPLRPQQPTMIRIVRRNDQDSWRTYNNDCY
ncbi:MAG: hypothetical protein ACKO1Q_10670 [Vulcanococcus sp.]